MKRLLLCLFLLSILSFNIFAECGTMTSGTRNCKSTNIQISLESPETNTTEQSATLQPVKQQTKETKVLSTFDLLLLDLLKLLKLR